jgi:hypothetical protein
MFMPMFNDREKETDTEKGSMFKDRARDTDTEKGQGH